ncbi:MAG: RNA 2',3'-cyclic phosphodiesterase [Candidatus Thorarchaeota archaeon]
MEDVVRAFLSIDIVDDTLLERIASIQNQLDRDAAKMKLVELENIHFTWRFFGDTSVSVLDGIREELMKLRFSTIDIQIAGVGAFPNVRRPRVIWVGVTENAARLTELKLETDELLQSLGYKTDKKFTPHATIARVRFIRDKKRLSDNIEALASERIGKMIVNGIRMTKSTLTPSGPVYETLWEIPAE